MKPSVYPPSSLARASLWSVPGEKPSMGHPDFVEARVRAMFDEARKILFEAEDPRTAMVELVDRYAAEFRADNPAYVQTWSQEWQDLFLKGRGLGTDDTAPGEPVKALIAETLSRFIDVALRYREGKANDEQLAFEIDAAVEDCQMLLRGLDNPAD